ncbi:glycosyltransferase family 2 protein [Pseudactinotalea sp.]|uniref:glycosyltransferase family 2 protein n=1 Tax=Pseudactinotalea sp. TaxID=1926260 RepID=UPI003B3B2A4C
MTSLLRRARQRLRATATVLLHGPGGLSGPRLATRFGEAAGPAGRRRLVVQKHDSAEAITGRHPAFEAAGVAPPRAARDRFARALSTDLTWWHALQEPSSTDPEQPVSVPHRIDEWAESDPLLGFATGFYRAHLVGPGSSADHVVAAALSGTPSYGLATTVADLPETVRDLVTIVDGVADLRDRVLPLLFQDELSDRSSLLVRRRATRHLAATEPAPLVSVVVPSNRPHQMANVFANVGRQRHPVELVLVLHGIDLDENDLRERANQAGVTRLVIVPADVSLTLGLCMNLGIEAASGSYVAKVDDDNYYGPEFVGDLVDAVACSGADIVGKWAHFVWLRSSGAVVLRYPDAEYRRERRVQGGSMLFSTDVVRSLRFSDIPRAVDSDILDRALERGYRIYSADRYNYVSVRGTDVSQHTWQASDASFFTKRGSLVFYGDPAAHVSV